MQKTPSTEDRHSSVVSRSNQNYISLRSYCSSLVRLRDGIFFSTTLDSASPALSVAMSQPSKTFGKGSLQTIPRPIAVESKEDQCHQYSWILNAKCRSNKPCRKKSRAEFFAASPITISRPCPLTRMHRFEPVPLPLSSQGLVGIFASIPSIQISKG